ncbi:hypothetical protein HK101_003965 [Irineochytrium annulatum]|nr:hypothetical protein HK101_003965 [Irineochytrium annulatum]
MRCQLRNLSIMQQEITSEAAVELAEDLERKGQDAIAKKSSAMPAKKTAVRRSGAGLLTKADAIPVMRYIILAKNILRK